MARLGGDEFTILLDEVGDAREATVIADRVQHALREPFHLDGREMVVAASIGIALAEQDAAPADVMRDADVAMYRAKADGKGRHAVFDARMHERVMRRLDMESELRRAIEDDGLEVVYQPIVQVATGRIVGFEALCRWLGPHGVQVEPAEFVPIAEETGLIVPLGRRVLETACRELAELARAARRRGARCSASTSRTASSPSRTSGTTSPRCSSAPGSTRARCAWRSRSTTSRTSRSRPAARSPTCSRTTACAGRSTTSAPAPPRCTCCTASPGDAVKIFGPLVNGMGRDGGSFEIVKAIVGLAHNLGLEVIAEGVETAGQLEHLRVLGCEFAQGYHVSPPLPAAEARALLAQGALVR